MFLETIRQPIACNVEDITAMLMTIGSKTISLKFPDMAGVLPDIGRKREVKLILKAIPPLQLVHSLLGKLSHKHCAGFDPQF